MNDMNELLAAERRARAFLFGIDAAEASNRLLEITDDPDGHALLAAARQASSLGVRLAARLAEPAQPSTAWSLLAPGCRRFARSEPGRPTASAAITRNRQRLPIPDPDAVWSIPLAASGPRVRKDDGTGKALSCAETREIDRVAVEDFAVPGICLMENAAVGAVTVALAMLKDSGRGGVLIVAGGGNNGGDGLAMARGFRALGIEVEVALLKAARTLSGDALANYTLLGQMGVSCRELASQPEFLESMAAGKALVVDALLGTGFREGLAPAYRETIELVNQAGVPILAVDLPSGLNGDTGQAAETAVRAHRTITFAAVKKGLREEAATEFVGELYLGDIGIDVFLECL